MRVVRALVVVSTVFGVDLVSNGTCSSSGPGNKACYDSQTGRS